jgi:hypothetical protein
MSKSKTHCRIIHYLEANDPGLAELMRATCADMTLGSTRGKPGITLLSPDKDYRAKIEKLAYSSDPADATKACDMLNALILRDVFKDGNKFMKQRSNIPNSLYPSQHVGVTRGSSKSVEFESGASATLDAGFLDSSKKSNLAVWNLKGEIPVTSDKPAKIERMQRGGPKGAKGDKTGSYMPTSEHSQRLRYQIALAVENEYMLCRMQNSASGKHAEDPYVAKSMSLAAHLMKEDPDLFEKSILPLISFDKLDFYLMVEPHNNSGNYLIHDAALETWWNSRSPASVGSTCKKIQALIGDQSDNLAEIDVVRKRLCELVDAKPRACVDAIEAEYATKYSGGSQLKLIQDTLRYVSHCAFTQLESGSFDSGRFNEIVNMIGECMYEAGSGTHTGNLLNKASIKYSIAPTEKIEEVKQFINSTMFMYIPMTEADAQSVKGSVSRPEPGSGGVWNIEKDLYVQHTRLLTESDTELEALLEKVDPEIRVKLKAKLGL